MPPQRSYAVRNIARKGWALFDSLLAVGMGCSMLASIGGIMADVHQRQLSENIASQINQIAPAARNYIDVNYQFLHSFVAVGQVREIPLSGSPSWNGIGDVASSSGSLPVNWSSVLPSGQTLHLLVRHIPAASTSPYMPDHLTSMLLTSGGSPMSDKQVGIASLSLSGMGASIAKHTYGTALAGQINGLAGSWSESASLWNSGGVPVTYGHVALMLTGGVGTLVPYLNRYNIGNSESSRLHTSIDVNSNDLNNIRTMTGVNTLRLTGLSGAVDVMNGANFCQNSVSGCGVSISDVGGLYDYGDGWLTASMSNSTYGGLHVAGDVKVDRNIATNGYSAESGTSGGLPNGWVGGVHTYEVYSEGTIASGHNGTLNATVGSWKGEYNEGSVVASTFSQGQVFRPNLTAVKNQACGSTAANSSLRPGTATDAASFEILNGDIAKDADGRPLTCVDGTWKSPSMSITESFGGQYDGWNFSGYTVYSRKPHTFCALTQSHHSWIETICTLFQNGDGYWGMRLQAGDGNGSGDIGCIATCID